MRAFSNRVVISTALLALERMRTIDHTVAWVKPALGVA